jgi:hypothetical protein
MTQNDEKLQNRMENFSMRSLLKNLPFQNPAQVQTRSQLSSG